MEIQNILNSPIYNRINNFKEMKLFKKRNRPTYEQKILLEKIFEKTQYPDLNLRTQLGLRYLLILIYFESKKKKIKYDSKKNSNMVSK